MNNVQTREATLEQSPPRLKYELEFLYPSAIFDVLDKLYSRMPRCYFPPPFDFCREILACALYVTMTNNLDFSFSSSSLTKEIEFLISLCFDLVEVLFV